MTAAAERFFVRHNALPTMPEVASRLLKSFDDDSVGLSQIAALIEKDGALTARVLRLANTAHYSPSHQIGSVVDAAHALGLETLRNLAMAACLSGAFPSVKGLDRAVFWRHSVATANYARILARMLGADGGTSDTAYLAGLMLRTGQLLMAADEPHLVADVEAHAAEPGSRFSLEEHRFGCTHADVTASLATHWQFPAALVEAFKDANAPLEIRPFSLIAAVLHVAEVLADAAEHHDEPVHALKMAVPELIEHLHLDLELLAARIAATGDPAAEVEQMLH
ncbi:HDOD domain-containing protein [Roseateles saccharophilus]|uniref:HD-like signal output (HDOD) protein n=1 Tax=Roseateles saccharophilus TaxID=304 RepID=A0A4R3UHP5_ROSSA|nr:HDOD domain-containing protein [Roseateles saccharophilus]MDG0835220.1 HDOD domain-containing protein [Roseateles saccharophilus]TCU87152.1 HD-like signal output (HDOD) protein [Roseateles saccharophilus]